MGLKISYSIADSRKDLEEILILQNQNLPSNISNKEAKNEGFVTLKHDFELLKKMNSPYPHVVAKYKDELIAYALVMLKKFSKELPILFPMFERLEKLTYNNSDLNRHRYFIMGQVCIKKGFRGQGVLQNLYAELQKRMKTNFDYMITEISLKNPRSIKAHAKIGFEEIHTFQSSDGENWSIILLDLKKSKK